MSLEGKTVFLTGAFGFIGSNLALHLDSLGAEVVALRRDEVRNDNPLVRKVLERITVVRGDLREMETVLRVINEYEAQLCIHLAAQAIVGVANRSPLSTFSSNIQGTWNLLEACRLCPSVEGTVSASSDKAYGTARVLPYREEDPLLARNPYDVSKACADLLAQAYGDHYGMPIVVSRCSNVYGPGDLNLSRIVPEICRSVALGQPPRLRSDGTMLRDFIHVEDVVRAYEAISAALLSKRCRQEVFNIGTGRPTRVIDMTNIIIEASGKDLRPVVGPAAPKGEIPHQYVAAEKIQQALGWGPKVELREGVRGTYRWYADYFSRSA